MFERIRKRDGRVVEFDTPKITSAIARAGKATGEFEEREARKLTLKVLTLAHELSLDPLPEVEGIQDIVERVLLDSPYHKTAKAYILYREQHAQIRQIAAKAGADLVDGYLQGLGQNTGWLVIFDRRTGIPPIRERTTTESAATPSGKRVAVIRA